MDTIKDIIIGLGAFASAFIMLGINEAIVKPNAIKFTRRKYKYLSGYIQPALDKLDSNLGYVRLINFIDEAILPPELNEKDQKALLDLVIKEFSLETHLRKTKQS
jgi:hypothetical protein